MSKIKKWTKIEDCPQHKVFIAVLKLGYKFRIKRVYVHCDGGFLMWRDLRTLDKFSIGSWRCIYYYG